jgi:hypothetical protein
VDSPTVELRRSPRNHLTALAVGAGAALFLLPFLLALIVLGVLGAAAYWVLSPSGLESRPVVLTISSAGLRDERLVPALVPWSHVVTAGLEPRYLAGGTIILELSPGVPVPEIRSARHFARGKPPSLRGRTLKLTLADLAFSQADVVGALSSYSSFKGAA